MRNERITLFVAATVMLGLAGTAQAVDWLKPSTAAVSDFSWSDPANWQDVLDANGNPGTDGVGDVPGIGGFTNVDARISEWHLTQNVTLNVDQPVDLGTGEFYVLTYSYNMTIKDSSGTGSASLTCGTYRCWRSSNYTISEIPIYASTKVMLGWRWGHVRFQNIVETPLVEVGDGDMTFTALPNPGDVYKFDAAKLWVDNQPVIPQLYVYDDIDPYTPGTPLAITIADGGIYGGYADGAFGTLPGNTVDASVAGGTVIVGAAQANFPNVVIGAGSALVGNMTGLTSADFGLAGDGKKVTFEQNSIYVPDPGGAEPTRAAMGGAILVKGIVDTSAAGTTTVGDDGSTTIYYAVGFGAYGTSTAINTTAAVMPGAGNLSVFVTARNANMGALTGLESVTTQAVDFLLPAGAGYVNLVGPINNGVLTGPKATTFNFIGQVGREHDQIIEISNAAAEIAAGQTFTVQNGIAYINTGSNKTFLKGTLEIGAGGALVNRSISGALSATGGTLAFQDRSLLFLRPGQEGMFENINVTTSGTSFVVVGCVNAWGGHPAPTYTLTDGTQLSDLLKASNIWLDADYDNNPLTFAGDGLTLGDGKWVQTIDGRTRSPHLAGIVRADSGTTIGFASMGVTTGGNLDVQADIVAPGATVLFNTTETLETCAYVSDNPAGNAHTNNRRVDTVIPNRPIIVAGVITAETIKAQNGTVTFQQDLNVPNLDIAGIATVTMATDKRATVTGTLSGTGKWTGGLGVTVAAGGKAAPGNGIGVLNDGGGALTFDNGAIYNWQVLDPDGSAGSQWDLVKGSTITFLGELILDIDDSLLVGSVDGKSFIVASASSLMGAPGSYSFLGDWHGTLVVEGNDLVLSGLSSGLPGDTNADGVVDAADFITLKKNLNTSTGAEAAAGDFDKSGMVDWADLSILMTNMGTTSGSPATAPEPATLGLLALGALAVLRRRRMA